MTKSLFVELKQLGVEEELAAKVSASLDPDYNANKKDILVMQEAIMQVQVRSDARYHELNSKVDQNYHELSSKVDQNYHELSSKVDQNYMSSTIKSIRSTIIWTQRLSRSKVKCIRGLQAYELRWPV